jgi:pSer/pThr/pTyr-binding forkhead associated (FHA) protein/subtilisin family serine protease
MDDREFRELPTPQPLKLDAVVEEPTPFLERLLARWRLLAGLVGIGLVIAVVSGILLLRSGGPGATEPSFDLPPSLEELAEQYPELAELLNDATLGSVYKDFLVAYESGGIEAARDLADQRGMLNDRDEIRITLVVDSADYIPAITEELQRAGITVEGSYKERINIGVPMALVEQLAQQQGSDALFQQLTQMAHVIRVELPAPRRSDAMQAGGIQSEGVSVTGADTWHTAGFTGKSIRIGVLDLGFDGYRGLLGTELPETVASASFLFGKGIDETGEVHGAACAEIVHDMAPDAELYLAAYDTSLVSMGQAVEWLLSQGVHIISNSTSSVVGPMDGSDQAASLVDDAARRGVLWVNSSGNAAEEHYRGLFTDADGDGVHEFPDGTEAMMIYVYAPDVTIALNWDDWQRVTEDYDLFLYDEEGDLVGSSKDMQMGLPGQGAAEVISGKDVREGIYYVALKGHLTTRPGTLDLYTLGAAPEFPVAEHSLGSPADARGALAIGATEYRDPTLASYSSQGPSNDGRLKPELSAPAGVSGATYAPDDFTGTSASTPHVAGAAALVWSAFPDYSAGQVRDFLQTNALDLGPPGPDSGFGYGRLRLPASPGETVGLPVVPTALPTAGPIPTEVPEPTAVSVLPGSSETPQEVGRADGVPLLLLGGLGLLGAVAALGGGGLLLAALMRSPRRAPRAAPPRPVAPAAQMPTTLEPRAPEPLPSRVPVTTESYGMLVGAGLTPAMLRPGLNRIGRSGENDIVLDSLLVSRRHAGIQCAGGRCTVEDLGSANGVFVNGRRVSRTVLSPGDRLRLGDVEVTYEAAGAPRASAWLELGTRRFPLAAGVTLGRSRDNDVHLTDGRASRRHARIDVEQGVYVISDLGSANGTFVNGERIQRQALRSGDEIRIGDSRLFFRR